MSKNSKKNRTYNGVVIGNATVKFSDTARSYFAEWALRSSQYDKAVAQRKGKDKDSAEYQAADADASYARKAMNMAMNSFLESAVYRTTDALMPATINYVDLATELYSIGADARLNDCLKAWFAAIGMSGGLDDVAANCVNHIRAAVRTERVRRGAYVAADETFEAKVSAPEFRLAVFSFIKAVAYHAGYFVLDGVLNDPAYLKAEAPAEAPADSKGKGKGKGKTVAA